MNDNAHASTSQKPEHILVQCASCNQPGFLESWSFISRSSSPIAVERLQQGKLFKYTCPVCRQVTTMAYPCLYYDEDHTALLLYTPNREQKEQAWQQLNEVASRQSNATITTQRLTFTTFEFCEKARLWADGYDDRVIELMKVAIKRGMLEEGIVGPRDILIYERTLDDGSISYIVSGEIPGDTVGVPQGYTYLKDIWLDKLNAIENEYCFDAAWANAFLP